jgi:hypothetical protein
MNDSALDRFFSEYIQTFLAGNNAARQLAEKLRGTGIGLMPLVDHCTIRTLDVDQRAQEFLDYGYYYDAELGVLEFDHWWAKVYRNPGYPALFIDQAFNGERGRNSLIPQWVQWHGDLCFHHIAILVEDIEKAIQIFKSRNIQMAGGIIGEPGSNLRQVFTKPENRNDRVYTVLELIQRRSGYTGFLPPQADGLMESTRK